MKDIEKINYINLIEVSKKIANPFSREILVAKIKEDLGEGFTVFYDLGNGIGIFVRTIIPKKDFILYEECNVSGASFIFNLGNHLEFIFKDNQTHILKKDNFLVGLSSNKFYVETPLQKNKQLFTLTIGMKEELFLKIAHPIKDIEKLMAQAIKFTHYIVEDRNIDSIQFELLDTFKKLDLYEDTLKSIYVESKATNLIYYTIEKIAKTLENSIINYDKNRISSLERAKDIIIKDYSTNLSIKEIAYKSAINECYLKKDFKEYYGMTILEMLQKRRLEVAKELLQKDYSVKEVALNVGYKHTGYFSKLFSDHFGVSPSNYQKQINKF